MKTKLAITAAIFLFVALMVPSVAGASTVNLGTASQFAVLAGAGITNTGATTIIGDVGTHPTPSQTGFETVTITGTNHVDDSVTQGAKADLLTAYNDAAGRPSDALVGELGGLTLVPGVYADNNAPDSMSIIGTLTLDGGGDPASVFIFQSGSTLITGSNSNVALINGAQACNIFWQVGTSATLGSGSHLEGTILASASISLGTGATINGRALASTGAVTMSGNTIQVVPCATPTTSTSPSPTQSETQTTSPSPTQSETQTTSPSPTQSETQTTSPSPTQSETQTTSPSPTQSETQTTSPSPTQSETQTTSPSPTQSETQTTSPSPTQSETQTTSPSPTQSETQTTSPSPTQSETQTTSPSPTQSETQTTSPSPTQSETQTMSPSPTQSETQTTTPSATPSESPSPTTPIPFFPSGTAAILGSVGALGGALLLLRRRV